MQPMLDKLPLPQVQEITTLERRVLAEHKPPGMESNWLQNMGRRPARVALWGVATGDDALTFIERLDGMFKAGKPLPFTADIVADARIEQMLVEDLHVQDLAGKPQRYAYVLTLREYIVPVVPETSPAVDTGVQDDAQSLMDNVLPGLTSGLDFATGLEQFVAPMSSLLARLQAYNASVAHARGG